MGPDWAEAQAAYARARAAGMSKARAEALGHVASRDDCWAFARSIAERVGVSRRTIQRAFAQGTALGMVRTARAKKGEVPPGASKPFECGWSHRWIIGRGLAGRLYNEAIARARAAWLARVAQRQKVPSSVAELARKPAPRRPPPGVNTQAWLEAELAERDRARQRDGPA